MDNSSSPGTFEDYEAACERYNRISGSIEEIKRLARGVIDWADGEYDAAAANLKRFQSSPGIALPQYLAEEQRRAFGEHTDAAVEAIRQASGTGWAE